MKGGNFSQDIEVMVVHVEGLPTATAPPRPARNHRRRTIMVLIRRVYFF